MNDLAFLGGAAISIFCFIATGLIVFAVSRMLFKNVQEGINLYMTKRKNNE